MSKYDDIINREYHGSSSMKKMPLEARAAQFAPFAALTGHSAVIRETARLTSEKIELSPDQQISLSQKLSFALYLIDEESKLIITFFLQDNKKSGGRYVKATGYIKKYLEPDRIIVLSDNSVINVDNIVSIEGKIFDDIFYH